MKQISLSRAMRILRRGIQNFWLSKPLAVSFEVTHSCTCNCHHCDKGGRIEEGSLLTPEECRRWIELLKPPVVQISGGEPLLRDDVQEIVRAIRQPNGLPYVIFVTNASLLTEESYLQLKRAGVDQFSISLDFPDERHDSFRRKRGLYRHLEELIPHLARSFQYGDIILNCAITRENLPCLLSLAEKAQEWGVLISYSAYSPLRTNDSSYFISSPEDLRLLRKTIEDLIEFKNTDSVVVNSEFTLRKTYQFFRDGSIPSCNAGRRFLVVRPDGYLNPCSMYPSHSYTSQKEILDLFAKNNSCGECWVAIRSYVEKPLLTLMKENLTLYFSRK